MRVAGVSINKENLPSREVVLKQALKTELYISDNDAEKKINLELDKCGLWNDSETFGVSTRKTIEEADSEIKELNKQVVETPKTDENGGGLHTTPKAKNNKPKPGK